MTSNNSRSSRNDDCHSCKDRDNPTQQTIKTERLKVCSSLYDLSGDLSKQEEKFKKETDLFELKKCLYVNIEDNYRRYRNLDITVGTELLQTNESIKTNVTSFNTWNKDLGAALKNIAKAVKEAKTKFGELKKAACDLKTCYNDSCNKAQKRAMTGKSEGCKPETPIDPCKDAEKIFDELICMPEGLASDIDSIFKSAFDVVGIQVFSNIETIEPLQKELELRSKAFQKQISDVVKQRETDLKKQQEELTKSVKELTTAAMDRNNVRSKFEGYYYATDWLCCPKCGCAPPPPDDSDCDTTCDPRLKKCEDDICKICGKVKDTFCCPPKVETNNNNANQGKSQSSY